MIHCSITWLCVCELVPAVGMLVGISIIVPLPCNPSSYRMFIHRSSSALGFDE